MATNEKVQISEFKKEMGELKALKEELKDKIQQLDNKEVSKEDAAANVTYLSKSKIKVLGLTLEESLVEAGSGSLPLKSIPSAALKFQPMKISVSSLARSFRMGTYPVVGYSKGNIFYIDLKAVLPKQISHLIESIKQV